MAVSGRAAKVAAARAIATRQQRRRKAATVLTQQSPPTAASGGLPTPPVAGGTNLPPWPAPADPTPGINAAGLQMSNMEGTAAHFHSHLDILVDGRPVPVAGNIGINQATGVMSDCTLMTPPGCCT